MFLMRSFVGFIIVLAVSSCSQTHDDRNPLQESVTSDRLNIYHEVVDKPMIDAFYDSTGSGGEHALSSELQEQGYEFEDLTRAQLSIGLVIDSTENMTQASARMRQLSWNAEQDLLAQTFISAVHERGNIVKSFQPNISRIVNTHFKLPFVQTAQSRVWLAKDALLIEYDNLGKPIAVMSRTYQATMSSGVVLKQYTTIYTGIGNMYYLDSRLDKNILESSFLRDYAH